ncbi:5'/3'-nucleotidase SurE [Actinokineospora pegani]|uniref:5'/3'-nucleotidase SurE n=1 Tax=Actinokineospora pegani TaxID=2654637 RepID=UPI0012E9E0CB|nr:5'/3'-nucleotidase SurE [Actinokineospora pegani]
MPPHVLVTNDDGIDSPGLAVLARSAAKLGWSVTVAAPNVEASGTSAGLTAATTDRHVTTSPTTLPGLPDVTAHAVAAHPALIALIGCHGAFGTPPDLLLSGVNHGANVGRAILHSGTVGATLTASINGTPAIAVSLDVPLNPVEAPHWDTAEAVLATLLPLATDLAPAQVLNINIPDLPLHQVRPPRWARLAAQGRVRSDVTRQDDASVLVGNTVVDDPLEPGTDAALLAERHTTVSPVQSVADTPTPDLRLPD